MRETGRWLRRGAAIVAVVAGVLLMLGGFGHLSAILEARAGQAFDYRFVSLLTTSGILLFPGLVAVAASFWLWIGRTWAFVSCLLSCAALMLYLALLLFMKARVPDAAVGDELYFMTAVVSIYFTVTLAAFLLQQRVSPRRGGPRRRVQPRDCHRSSPAAGR